MYCLIGYLCIRFVRIFGFGYSFGVAFVFGFSMFRSFVIWVSDVLIFGVMVDLRLASYDSGFGVYLLLA